MSQKAEGQLWIKLREMFMDEAEKFKAHQSHTMCSAHADQFGRDALEAVLAASFRYVGPEELPAARLAGKIEGMEEAYSLWYECEVDREFTAKLRAKIAELEASPTEET